MNRNPDNWKWGIFYFNPKDPRMVVPKQNFLLGGTLNFGNIYTYLILLGIILLILIVSFFHLSGKTF
ncbi:MAG: hypothetical protein GXO86_07235 [Chlorobi bacterium]|nr:hypothetical protein [Chlorobiota bacterium]